MREESGVARRWASTARRGLLTLAVAWSGAWVTWGASTVLDRARAAATAKEPYFWRFWSPEVVELRELLAAEESALPAGTRIAVETGPGLHGDGSQLALWAQYLAPRLNWLWARDLPEGTRFDYRLRWNQAADAAGWTPLAARGRFLLERRESAPR